MQRFVDQPTKQAIAKVIDTLAFEEGKKAVEKLLGTEDGIKIKFKDEDGAPKLPDAILKDILPPSTHAAIEKQLYPVVKARLLILAIEKLFEVKLSREGHEELIRKVHLLIEKAVDEGMKEKIEKLIKDVPVMEDAKDVADPFNRILENPVVSLESKLKDVLQDTKAMNLFIKHVLPALTVKCLSKADKHQQLDKQLIEAIRSELINIGTRDGKTMATLRTMAKNFKEALKGFDEAIEHDEGALKGAKEFFKKALPSKAEKILKILAVQKEIKAMKSDLKELAKEAAKDAKQERKQVKAALRKENPSITAELKNASGKVIGEARKSMNRKSTTSDDATATV